MSDDGCDGGATGCSSTLILGKEGRGNITEDLVEGDQLQYREFVLLWKVTYD